MNFHNDPFSEHLYLQHSPDQEVRGIGWAGLYRSPDPSHGGDILHETPDGLVHRTTCITPAEIDQAWREVEEEVTLEGAEPEVGDFVLDPDLNGMAVVSRHGTGQSWTFRTYLAAINYLRTVRPGKVWIVDRLGNFTEWSMDG